MKAYTYIEKGRFELQEKPKPTLQDPKDAIVKVTLASICSSDLHIKHGSVPRAVTGITVGHEMVGIVEQVGSEVCIRICFAEVVHKPVVFSPLLSLLLGQSGIHLGSPEFIVEDRVTIFDIVWKE